ncbi:MAG: hypothetical protein HFF80_01895 [Oscillospiraceae bacterium]|jgi:hypothetical protein|nr:hypothetical protein [Oscillospiraceae bacterium]
MSASREKKKRQELLASGAVDPKAARQAEQRAAEKKSNILYGVIAAVFVVVAIALVVYNSGIIQRSKTAVTIDGRNYTVPEAAFYYGQAYQSFLNSETGYFYTAIGALNTQASLKSQNYSESQTWDEHFKEQAVENMRFVHAAVAAAKEAGVALESAELEDFNNNLAALKETAAKNGYSYKGYLGALYGPTMTPSIYESCSKDLLLAGKYADVYSAETFIYTDDQIQTYYNDHKENYDLVDGAMVTISGAPEAKTDADGNAVEATDEEKAAAMAEAKETADAILAAYQAGGDLESLANENSVGYSTNITYSSSVTGQWFYDESRKAGDAAVLENQEGNSYYVVLFNSRERDEALDYNVRHILVTKENLELAEGEEGTDEQVLAKAQEILASWDGTEDGFASLANQYSKDGGSNTNGGLYENVAKGVMVPAFQNWCYEDGRKSGDTGIVASDYGQHIMYFVGYGSTPYWHFACENALRSAAASDWQTGLIDSVTAEVDAGGMNLIGQ